MPHFSRLTDIVTCNLTEILKASPDPAGTLTEIIAEMEEGLAGAQRSVQTANRARQQLQQELNESLTEAETWDQQARQSLQNDDENAARMALFRKKEALDLIAGLEQQVKIAQSNWESLMTTYRALEARLAEAARKQSELGVNPTNDKATRQLSSPAQESRGREVEDELAELKRKMQR